MVIKRRQFLKSSLAAGLAAWINPAVIFADGQASILPSQSNKPERPFKFSLGLASYTFRAFSLDQTIAMAKRLGLEKICLKDVHLPLTATANGIKQATDKVRAAGLDLYACGVVYMKKAEEVERAFAYARTAGMRIIIASPNPELLPLIDQKVKQTGLSLAIHNHGPGDKHYPTPAEAYKKIQKLDRRIGLCLDIGHTARAGIDPAEAAAKFADRLLDVHIKDVSAASSQGQTVEIGRGVIDIADFLRTLIRLDYSGVLAFEYEKDEKDPLPGLAESVGYVRGMLSAVLLFFS